MVDMVKKYSDDMLPYAHMSLTQVFDLLKSIPFRPDPENAETLQRPKYTVEQSGLGGDCDDKAIALAAFCQLTGIPWIFVAVRRPDMDQLHHVLCYVNLNGRWIPADATYPFNSLGRERERYAEYLVIS